MINTPLVSNNFIVLISLNKKVNILGPEKIRVTEDMLSEYQKKLASDLDLKTGGEKLLLTLNSKKNYVCHGRYSNLTLY